MAQNTFEKISVTNFMRIKDKVTIPLAPVTILVGGNGSGKSSILKAVHWAVRCAILRDKGQKTTLEQMDYTPSRDFLHLSHKKKLKSGADSPQIEVELISEGKTTKISIKSTRNDAGTNVSVQGPLKKLLEPGTQPTAYIPGLAGLSESETLLATPVLHRRAASGEGGSVLRHILLGLAKDESIEKHEELIALNTWVGKVFPGVQFWIKFDKLRDVHIDARFLTTDMEAATPQKKETQWKPLEMAGTGFLQVVQIFAYLLHFKPKLLLIDEPDSHLHPGTQERLIKAIEEAAKEFPDTQFLITTHSPNFVRASSSESQVLWMADGELKTKNTESIRQRMGWGALDKEVILITEDGNTSYMKNVLDQWPELARKTLIWPTFGSGSLPNGSALKNLQKEWGIKVIVHRDRDFMSDDDKAAFEKMKGYDTNKIPFWMPAGSDIEAGFADQQQLMNLFDITKEEATQLISDAVNSLDEIQIETDFNTAYQSATNSLAKVKGNVPSRRWRVLGGFGPKTIKGKVLLGAIESMIRSKYNEPRDPSKLRKLMELVRPQYAMHEDLKDLINQTMMHSKKTIAK